MNPNISEAAISEVLASYTKITGRDANAVVHDYGCGCFLMAGYSPADMETVCKYLMRQNRQSGRDFQASLRLDRMFGDLARFDSLLAEAKAVFRNRIKPPTPRDQALREFRGCDQRTETGTAIDAKAAIQKLKASL